VTFEFKFEYLQCIACDVMKLCTDLNAKFERNRAVRNGVIAISIFDLDLEHVLNVALGS